MNPVLGTFSRLVPVSAEALSAFEKIIKHKSFKKGTALVKIGDIPHDFYFIAKGVARVHYKAKSADVTDYFAIDNQFIGALPALFTSTASHKGIEVIEDSDVYYFSYAEFDQLCSKYHDLERGARRMSIVAMVEGQKRIESIRFYSAKERYDELERLYPGITNRAPLKFIASYLGVTQVSISRIRAGKQ